MNIPALPSTPIAPAASLEQLERNPNASEAEKIAEVGRQFEAILLRQILADATKNLCRTGVGAASTSNGIYQDMITNSLADSMSRSGGLGLARVITTQLQHESKTASSRPDAPHV